MRADGDAVGDGMGHEAFQDITEGACQISVFRIAGQPAVALQIIPGRFGNVLQDAIEVCPAGGADVTEGGRIGSPHIGAIEHQEVEVVVEVQSAPNHWTRVTAPVSAVLRVRPAWPIR